MSRGDWDGYSPEAADALRDARLLREAVKKLTERVAVLEREVGELRDHLNKELEP